MDIEFKPRIGYFNWIFLIIFLVLSIVFGKLNLYIAIGLLVAYSIMFFDLVSRTNIIVLNEKKIVVKRKIFGISKEIKSISRNNIKQITLISPYRIRGIKVLLNNNCLNSFKSNLRKNDLIQFGESIKTLSNAEVLIEGYFKTRKL